MDDCGCDEHTRFPSVPWKAGEMKQRRGSRGEEAEERKRRRGSSGEEAEERKHHAPLGHHILGIVHLLF